jgi:hypothetical protein
MTINCPTSDPVTEDRAIKKESEKPQQKLPDYAYHHQAHLLLIAYHVIGLYIFNLFLEHKKHSPQCIKREKRVLFCEFGSLVASELSSARY